MNEMTREDADNARPSKSLSRSMKIDTMLAGLLSSTLSLGVMWGAWKMSISKDFEKFSEKIEANKISIVEHSARIHATETWQAQNFDLRAATDDQRRDIAKLNEQMARQTAILENIQRGFDEMRKEIKERN